MLKRLNGNRVGDRNVLPRLKSGPRSGCSNSAPCAGAGGSASAADATGLALCCGGAASCISRAFRTSATAAARGAKTSAANRSRTVRSSSGNVLSTVRSPSTRRTCVEPARDRPRCSTASATSSSESAGPPAPFRRHPTAGGVWPLASNARSRMRAKPAAAYISSSATSVRPIGRAQRADPRRRAKCRSARSASHRTGWRTRRRLSVISRSQASPAGTATLSVPNDCSPCFFNVS